ncbi:flagellar basal body-associated protein FliL [Neobacillus sp. PS3-40]|uniref:flagellar basal body-associated protein FliL n=1 Tax=Neobacillus sp. PS3-40 TaxID=3070679 RepID=UPI0027E08A7A|nr:flagellar basal body-associated protein FliL [Neobacillus sp. PS3-40]WML43709.1 flagellar basal body-associated protein FliL [Neobacillus sp. PS3-40]
MLIILVSIALIGGGAAYYVIHKGQESKDPSIDDILKTSVDVAEITTNLKGDDYIKISFKIQTDSKAAKDELTKRDFQVKNIIIEELSEKKAHDLQGKVGKLQLENMLRSKINELMQDGKVVKVYITESLLQ